MLKVGECFAGFFFESYTEALGNAYASDVYIENEDDVVQELWRYLKEQNI